MCLSSLFCFHGNIGLQGIEATFPELPILLKPHIGLPERARPKAAYMLSTSDLAMYKAGALQHHHGPRCNHCFRSSKPQRLLAESVGFFGSGRSSGCPAERITQPTSV